MAAAPDLRSNYKREREAVMDTKLTAAEGHFELEEKYRRWKETYLPDGNLSCIWPIDDQLQTLGDERLKAAHDAAVAGHIKPIGNFHYAAGLTTGLLFKRGLLNSDST